MMVVPKKNGRFFVFAYESEDGESQAYRYVFILFSRWRRLNKMKLVLSVIA